MRDDGQFNPTIETGAYTVVIPQTSLRYQHRSAPIRNMRLKHINFVGLFVRHLFGAVMFIVTISNVSASQLQKNAPTMLLQQAEPIAEKFFTKPQWDAVRNLTAASRAVVIVPRGGEAGLLIGGAWGKGVMFVRHGEHWSNPIFIKLGAFQFGVLMGGQKVGLIGALLTNRALDRALQGKALASGSGDLTVIKGLSARAAGGTTGGVEFLSVSVDKGLYFGGSFERLRLHVDEKMNQAAYGKNFDPEKMAAVTAANYPPAKPLLTMLDKAVHQAFWGS